MRRFPLIVTLVLLIVLTLSPASSTPAETKSGVFTASPTSFSYRMTPEECLLLYYQTNDGIYELCPGDMVLGTEVSKAYVRGHMATFMNAALGQTQVSIGYGSGPTPSGADYYLLYVMERLY